MSDKDFIVQVNLLEDEKNDTALANILSSESAEERKQYAQSALEQVMAMMTLPTTVTA